VVQFILTQPTVAFVSLMLLATGKYESPAWQIVQTIIYNISYAWALYCLYVFYLAIHQNIKNFRPIAKFASVKSIIFATYYQSLFLKLTLADHEHAVLWNDLLLCVEMVVFATALVFAFPVSDFQGGVPDRRVLENVKDVFTFRDILHDVYHNFTSTYDDYALQRSESETPANAAGIMKMRNRLGARSTSVQSMLVGSSHSQSSGGEGDGSTHSNPLNSPHSNNSSAHSSSKHSNNYSNSAPSTPNGADQSAEYLESGQLNGKLGRVALQMSERYRGRSKRLAFNALLRGSQPIRATLRPHRKHHHSQDYGNSGHGYSGHGYGSGDEAGGERKSDEDAMNPLLPGDDELVEVVFSNHGNHDHTGNNGSRENGSGKSNKNNIHGGGAAAAIESININTNATNNSSTTSASTTNVAATTMLGRLTLSLKPHRSPTNPNNTTSNNNNNSTIAWPRFTHPSSDSMENTSAHNPNTHSVSGSAHSSANNSNNNSIHNIELTMAANQHSADTNTTHTNTTHTNTTHNTTLTTTATTSTPTTDLAASSNFAEIAEAETEWGDYA